MPPASARVLVASNRGPVSFTRDADGSLALRRGGGGLIAALQGAAEIPGALWVCAALTDADREACAASPDGRLDRGGHDTAGAAVRMLGIAPLTFHRAYNTVANSTLWFVNHLLFDTPNAPHFDAGFTRAWESYVDYDQAFADALAAEAAPGASVVVQDYHLVLTPAMLRRARPDLRIGHFTHTPWAGPEYFSMLPGPVARAVLEGMLGADHVGFLSPRWAAAFIACCEELLGARGEGTAAPGTHAAVTHSGRRTTVGVHALGVDADWLRARARRPDVEARRKSLQDQVGDHRLIVRIDRTELSKNIVRGLGSYRELLRAHPEWLGTVVHLALAYPSRHDLPEYREYTASVQRIASEISDEFGTADWQPLILEVGDDFARSLAGYRLAEVLVVNPLRDGMNLVAKEGPVLSDEGCALVLSEHAGAADELGAHALTVNPYDVSATAEAMHRALLMDPAERSARCTALAAAATRLPPRAWLAEQLDALR